MKSYHDIMKDEIEADADFGPKIDTKNVEGARGLTAQLRKRGGMPFWEGIEVEGPMGTDCYIDVTELAAFIDLLVTVQQEVKK